MQIHPVVGLFPRLSDHNFVKLEESIKTHGCQVAVVMWRDKATGTDYLIDGGHRKTICDDLKVEYPITEFVGTEDEAIKMAWTLNDDRRHLSPKQRLDTAAQLANILAEAADKRMKAGTLVSIDTRVGKSREIASEMTGESPASIQRAQTIIKNGTPALQKAWREKVSTADAAQIAKEPAKVQNHAATQVLNGHAKTLTQAVAAPQTDFKKKSKDIGAAIGKVIRYADDLVRGKPKLSAMRDTVHKHIQSTMDSIASLEKAVGI